MLNYKVLSGRISLLVSLSFLLSFGAGAQTDKQQKEALKQQQLKATIDAKNYRFLAQSATPLSGVTRQLSSNYTLTLRTDSLVSDLPYFGRAYMASPGDTEGGIQFTTKEFDYVATEGKKGGWEITITPKNVQKVQKMQLSVSDNGYATLQVISTYRQMISFYGYIEALAK